MLHILVGFSIQTQTDFVGDQKKFGRVKIAYTEKGKIIFKRLNTLNIAENKLNILIVAYKDEGDLELFVKNKSSLTFEKIESYKICAKSGSLGPKRKYGDGQVPEGFYTIDRFNPTSSYYLSLGINYPNQSDRKISNASNLGGDIFIHGSCVSIGCLPMTDEKIKEIYIYACQAKNSGQQKIPVYIFPFKMTDEKMREMTEEYKSRKELITFWNNIQKGYLIFEKEKKELAYTISSTGIYEFQ